MKKLMIYLLILIFNSCGNGIDQISHTGICDGYDEWSTSSFDLPWTAGETFKISQANCGAYTHLGAHRYAYDIIMDIGTDILAAKAGTVIEVEEANEDGNGCPDANFVKIEHADGSVAAYFHLTKNGALVTEGSAVVQGDIIAKSGNSGCSTDPHLHFVVFADDIEGDSIPVTFQNTEKNVRGLKSSTDYTAL